jgi:dihydrolipoamide dehydrogenase
MPNTSFDLIVIGAGPGGYVAAIRAAQLGMKVACVEKEKALGGTCLRVGCIPSKALLDSSERFHQANSQLKAHGIGVGGVTLDLTVMMERKDRVVKTLTVGVAGLLRKNKVAHIRGSARLASASTVEIEGDSPQTISAPRILIATGSAPIELPAAPFDGQRIISSTEALCLERVPAQLAVIGGGAIGLELGSVWNRLGAEVTVIEMLDRLVPGMDIELSRALQRSLEKQGLVFHFGARLVEAEIVGSAVVANVDKGGERMSLNAERLLVAVGRRPFTDELGLRTAGIETDAAGRIPVNERYETAVAGVFAIGDVIAGPMLAHKAEEEGVAAVELMAGLAGHVNYDAIPSVVYTWPELASVGLAEEEATKRGHQIRTGSFPFAANGRARCMGETEGMAKVVAEAKTDRLLGVHILGAGASDLIAEAAVAIEFGASAEDIARSVHAHPTLAEALKEAALATDGRAIHI